MFDSLSSGSHTLWSQKKCWHTILCEGGGTVVHDGCDVIGPIRIRISHPWQQQNIMHPQKDPKLEEPPR